MKSRLQVATMRPGQATPALQSIQEAPGPVRMGQEEIRQVAQRLLERLDPRLLPYLSVFDNAGIRHRNLAQPIEWYLQHRGWKARTDAYVEVGLDMLETAATGALEQAHQEPADVDAVVFVTSTGIATPSLDARLAQRMGMRPDVRRLPLWGLGCAAGVAGLARAADQVRAYPGSTVLLLSLELCSLAFLRGGIDKKMVVASSLFSDGAAAALLTDDADGRWTLGASRSHLFPNTQHIMGWDVVDEGLGVVISPDIPRLVREEAAPMLQRHLEEHDLRHASLALHPGGAKVIAAYEEAGLAGRLQESRHVLEDHGNMSSPTVLYVLNRCLKERQPVVAGALGPGFASEVIHLHPN